MKKVITILIVLVVYAGFAFAGEKAREGRFIAYDNGTVLDTRTNLMWAAGDNGSDITWMDAKSYCENYRGGGYTDWRMPTLDELEGLYDASKARKVACKISVLEDYSVHVATGMIDVTSFSAWASETRDFSSWVSQKRDSESANFYFAGAGKRNWTFPLSDYIYRALPVRSKEKEVAAPKEIFVAPKETFVAPKETFVAPKIEKPLPVVQEVKKVEAAKPVIIEKGRQTLNVKFDFGKAIIKKNYYKAIDDLAEVMKQYPDTNIVIEGHTDNVDSFNNPENNIKLSQARADSIRQCLIDKFGINVSRITAVGYGPNRPIASNDTEEGRQKNRRVEAAVDYLIKK